VSDLIPFQFENNQVRVVSTSDEPWFVAKDVAVALGYTWKGPADNLGHIPEQWKGVRSVRTPGGSQRMAVLSEQGLYFFLGRSDKPKALPFQMWLAGDVVPSIRKTGQYKADWHKERHASAASFKVLTAMLQLKRELEGKETKPHHYINEAKLINWAITGQFTDLDRDNLDKHELNLLARLEERSACLIAMSMSYPLRKQALKEYVDNLKVGAKLIM
jgi:prophage antirepressor-like protein